ncbi:MAG: AAA family ATPase [Terracidiphilus sp.]|jgi:pilus assembly protein CpaE
MRATPQNPGAGDLAIALIGPDERRRKAVAGALAEYRSKAKRDFKGRGPGNRGAAGRGERSLFAGVSEQVSVDAAPVREFTSYPESIDDLPRVLQQHYDVIIVDLDSDPEFALYLVEGICAYCPATVMVYSEKADLQLAVRFMRAGAREFLTLPLAPDDIAGALARVSIRRPEHRSDARNVGNLFVFFGVKGGSGVTTIAANFALALAQESSQSTLLIDFGLPLGDAAINLGMSAEYSTANALQDFNRLDANFLSGLLARHSSGLFVLAAPNEFSSTQASKEAIDKLLGVARQNYDYVVVDAGSRLDLKDSALFDESATIYLITQVGVSELRNANRLISKFFYTRGNSLQIVLNRYIPHSMGLDDKHIAKALTRPAQWTVPDDYATARRTANTANPIVLDDSPISIAIRKMARSACGLPAIKPKKKILGIFS